MTEPTIINPRKPWLWWNQPWTIVEGCTPCSAGCHDLKTGKLNCWALGRGQPVGSIRLREDRLEEPLHWRRPRTVFVLNDLFHENVPGQFIMRSLIRMEHCKQHTFLVLTKRPERAVTFRHHARVRNVWLGVTVENNYYLSRVEELVQTRAAVRWVNAHLLGPLDLSMCLAPPSVPCPQPCDPCDEEHPCSYRLDWLAIECNRPFRGDPAEWRGWCKALVTQASLAGVPVWVKQIPTPTGRVSHDFADFPEWARRREFPRQPGQATDSP